MQRLLDESTTIGQQPVPAARASNKGCLELSLASYLELLEWSGRQWRSDKRGAIADDQPDILHRLGLAGGSWMQMLRGLYGRFRRAAGRPTTRAQEADRQGRRCIQGIGASRDVFGAETAPGGR